ncbi:hypothetical protein R3P38DRAFT_3176561 [Favolaschia claudopus]|uniref:F-box domain-containing protein n=1 Tax=Favolaschia claudopus TaxID=2862362 RepID=A0AAW0CVP8_9AGAR
MSSRALSAPGKRIIAASLNGLVFPMEILGEIIFLACGAFDDRPASYDAVRNVYLLVCVLWYRLVANDSRFWTGLFIDRTTTPHVRLISTAFRRARARPVHLVLNTRSRALFPRPSFEDVFSVLRSSIDQVISQVGAISVEGWDDSRTVTVFEWLEACDSPNVRYLELVIAASNPPNPNLLHRALLAFSHLDTLVHRFSNLLIPHMHASTLSRLHLGPISRNRCEHCFEDIRLFLESCVQVTHLNLDDIQCGNGPPQGILVRTSCYMPSVTHLAFNCESAGGYYLWSSLRVPSARVLQVSGPSVFVGFVSGIDPELYNPSLGDVEVLDLRMPITGTLAMKNILANYPKLVRLDLRKSRREAVVALVDMRPFVSAPLCPDLLSIHVGNQVDSSQLRRVLAARKTGHFAAGCTMSYEYISGLSPPVVASASFRMVDGALGEVPYEEAVYTGLDF